MDHKSHPRADFKDIREMNKKEARREIQALQEGIDHHNYLYYVKNRPDISDGLYDKLLRRLQELENAFPEFQSETSPTQRVGSEPVSKLKKIKHTKPMQSLNAALDESEAEKFIDFVKRKAESEKIRCVLEPKFDGFSVEVVYEKGKLKFGATRGDGETGEDITHNIKTINTVPLNLRNPKRAPSFLSVRGEVFMTRKGFQHLNKERVENGEEPFANPRNAAAGIMRQLDPQNVAGKPLDVFFYDILQIEGEKFSCHWEELEKLPKWGLKTNESNKRCSSFDAIRKYHTALSKQRDGLEYEIDGIVVKVDDFGIRDALGTRQRSPRWALAWKFPPKEEITTLEDIAIQVGRTGMLTPVALLHPVEVSGVTVSRATLHNEDEVRKKDVRPGDRVRIARAGDVIPEIVERVKQPGRQRKAEFSIPSECPACGSEVYREGAYYFCTAGLSCPPQVIGRIVHYASRDALNIVGLGSKTVKDLVRKELAKDIADLYQLSVKDILKLNGFARKSARKLHKALQDSKEPRLDRFVYALGIRHVGRHVARVLAQEYRNLESLKKAAENELQDTDEIGPEIARSVAWFFRQKENRKILRRLSNAGINVQDMPSDGKGEILKGNVFVFTGKLREYTRREAERLVQDLGGRTSSSVSGETAYVVVGENPGSKYEEARKLGTKIIHEKDFTERVQKKS